MNLFKSRRKQFKVFFITLLTGCFFMAGNVNVCAQEQTISVTGNVKDQSGMSIIGATIIEKGSVTNGTITDIDGNYQIKVPKDAALVASFIGYKSQEVQVAGKSVINFVISEETTNLDELIVVGYGVQKKSDVTGAVTRVSAEDIVAMPVKDAVQAMQGKTAGVDITSNQRPGETGSITIRGIRSLSANQSPLYVVDGMVVQSGGIDNINPNDIETIDILKDASATAVYGSRGANGVVLVTTKKGKAGEVSFNYSGSVTIEKMYDVTEMMDAAEWLDYARLAKFGSTTPSYISDKSTWGSNTASWANIEKGWVNGVWDASKVGNYNWGDHGKRTAVSTEHTISASGGTEKFKGYGSFGYLRQEGTQPDQLYQRYTAKTNFEASPTNWFKFGTTMNLSYGEQDYGYSFTKSSTGPGDYYSALKSMLPWTVPYDENGEYIRNPAAGDVNIINPINELDYNTNNRQTLRATGSFYSQLDFGNMWKPLDGLSYRIQFGPEFKYYRLGVFNAAEGINGDGNNAAKYNTNNTRAYTLDNLLYYNKTFANLHKVGLTAMQSFSKYHYENGDMKATDVASTSELWYNLASGGDAYSLGTGLSEKQMESYMLRGNYTFNDKYMLTASMRWDGASQLAEGNKWASFPSLALGWRIDQEDFMNNASWIDGLKARFGYGVTGNAAIKAYDTRGLVQSLYYNWGTTSSELGYVASDPSAKYPPKMANPELSWERTTQYNIGVDYVFFNGRLSGSIDAYKTKTTDLLMVQVIPSLTGYDATWANVGETKGSGIDLQINTVNIKSNDFNWETSITWSKDQSEISKLNNGKTEDLSNSWFIGEDVGVYYDYVYDGIWKTSEAAEAAVYGRKPGQIKVKDLNNDGVIDANEDRQIVGKKRPDWSGGMTNTFKYKNFDLSFFIYSRWGNTFRSGKETLDGRFTMRKIDYWIAGVNEDAEYYSPGSNGEAADTYASSMNYQDGSFVKMRNISLGYNFTPKQLKKLGISKLKVYAQCMNPFTIYSKCDYLDTDLSGYNNNTTSTGSSTTLKSFVFGLNLGF
ncbi:SusC/RagA family TonB-linked outer membrane protein [Labilibaculum euxinus]|uniref:SusC/RagA family TonB-linked outer membrane protein n=1 Tax=Labilibaculum euxinus TaxID=2686357 RepID=A0A7M4D1Y2_9BACT|nr:TonB-dependent receptor [Labilibaculum euxinus]MUP36661.1 SusC/RagA family TonB-linked outer membrane protein [Labilibaculum euxinus]MVB05866.1 SusC/RagA family TonB-linked outer membrane protein [Labilibaculum euxinus]